MKGKYIILDLTNMNCIRDNHGEVIFFSTEEAARDICIKHNLNNFWIGWLVYNHVSEEIVINQLFEVDMTLIGNP